MIQLKPLVKCHPNYAMAVALLAVERIFGQRGVPLIITAGVDGKHMDNSLHYKGLAFDFRVKDLPLSERPLVIAQIRQALGTEFDVILEAEGTDNVHGHLEFQPK